MMKRSRLTALSGALALAIVTTGPATAQDEPVPFLDAAGTQLGTITVREVADPYTEFEPTRPPAAGQRYVLLTLTFEAQEDQAFPIDPRQVQLLDSAGFLYAPAAVPRPADDVVPNLQSLTLAPFDRGSGVVGYSIPAHVEIIQIVYRGDGSRIMPIANPGVTGAVAVGEPKIVAAPDGTSLGSITIREVTDPFTGFDPARPPAAGQRFVLLTTAFEAAEDQAMRADPGLVYLKDSNGTLYRPTQVYRPEGELLQNLEIQPLSPTDRISGVIGYQLPVDTALDSILYGPEGNRFVPVADISATPAAPAADSTDESGETEAGSEGE